MQVSSSIQFPATNNAVPVVSSAAVEQDPEAQNSTFKPVEEANLNERVDEEPNQESRRERKNTEAQDLIDQRREQELIQQLAERDREVRAHEAAHAAVGGPYAGSPSFSYERGPNGLNYAVAGEVPIDTSSIPGDPEATLEKAEQVRRAANAPAEPSPQDRQVATAAGKLKQDAQADILQERTEQERARREALRSKEENLEQRQAAEQSSFDKVERRIERRAEPNMDIEQAADGPSLGEQLLAQAAAQAPDRAREESRQLAAQLLENERLEQREDSQKRFEEEQERRQQVSEQLEQSQAQNLKTLQRLSEIQTSEFVFNNSQVDIKV